MWDRLEVADLHLGVTGTAVIWINLWQRPEGTEHTGSPPETGPRRAHSQAHHEAIVLG